jgi:transketolase
MGVKYKENSAAGQWSPITKDYLENAKKEYTLQMRIWTAKQINSARNGHSGVATSPEEVLRSRYSSVQQSNSKPANPKTYAVNAS